MKNALLSAVAVLALLCGATKNAHAVYDGTPSTGSFTVVDTSKLATAKATGSLVVLSTSAAKSSRITVGNVVLTEGREWSVSTSSYTAAISLKTAINANSDTKVAATYVAADNSLLLTAADYGTLYNGVGLKTSAPTGVSTSAATLTGGVDNLTLTINAVPLMQGRDWFVQDVASNTAINIAAGVNNHPILRTQVEAVALSTVIYLRAISSPVAYPLTTSLAAGISVSQANMSGGSSGNLARSRCDLGRVNALPTSNYPAGCHLTLSSDGKDYLSTETVTSASSWLSSTLVSGAIDTGKLATDSVTGDKILAGTIGTSKLASGVIVNGDVTAGAIDTTKLASDAVTTAKILDANVTTGKLATGAVDTGKIATGAVDTNKLGTASVTTAKVAAGAIDTDKIGTDAVTAAKVLDGAITEGKIGTGAVTSTKVGAQAIDTTKLLNSGVSGTGTLVCFTGDGKFGKVTEAIDTGKTGTCAPF
jgi:hypothetical protein